ncbi:protein phosphatase 2C domain-containing protein [Rivularia sp. UHCC 0363]|uniref:protein phosphatase 2C domain-containing protein n=1 Tax=Rivularia sp. UHCC 0363 TaxID=3110244 RepID=UPI002B1F5C19|nr:protein phosphatase 2C domain-containing protein [Rivularia sp. UHCC 0363]MEA5595734.1 protein phosphatase 2C domain-containing protein [Rivularia sp. UHCC 0363]
MARQSLAFSIFLFFIIVSILLVLFAKKPVSERRNKLEIDIQDKETNNDQPNDKVASQELETQLTQELLANKQTSSESEQLRNIGDYVFRIRSFHIQKKGLSEAECEDKNALSKNSLNLRVAVADGATESLFSDVWADILVNNYVEKGADFFQFSELESANQKFVQKTSQQILGMPETRQWFMYEKLERGTHATLAAVEFSSSLERVQILTVGDSCVFWCNGNADEVNMLPELSPEDFGSFPASICHLSKTWQSLEQKIVRKEVTFQNTLQMILCTDALACWLVTKLKSQPSNWERLFQISDDSSFTNFIETLREQNNIRNDDVTAVLIDVLPLNV